MKNAAHRLTIVFLAMWLLFAIATPANAHHGTAAISSIGVEGPGAALDTTSPLPLGQGTVFVMGKGEFVSFQQRPNFSNQKAYSSFNTVASGYGLMPWLSAFVFQPYNLKSQHGSGTNDGLGDTNLMLAASFKWDEGLRLTPEKESLDELADWHFSVWASCSLPLGATEHTDKSGAYFVPDMQTGFRGPSPGFGIATMKQLAEPLTLLLEANYQHFFPQRYSSAEYNYQFGGEARLNGALVYRAWAAGSSRLDLAAELSGLNLQRDRSGATRSTMQALEASGGTILYGQLGLRATLGSFSLGLSIKRAAASSLNEGAYQQGSEGLEAFRAALTLGYALKV